jgi:SAM-dependent methyltransferase
MITRAIEVAQLPQQAKILELGCGPGTATLPFAKQGFSLVSLEPSQAAYHLAKQNCVEFANVEIKNLTFEEWGVPDLKFDAVLAATSWHWLSPETAYAKAYEAMKNRVANLKKINILITDLRTDAIKERHWRQILQKATINKSINEMILGDFWNAGSANAFSTLATFSLADPISTDITGADPPN